MRCLVVGQAKSGTTALFSSISQAMDNPTLYFEAPASTIGEPAANAVAKIIIEHELPETILRLAARFDHRILLVRDPRDNLISRLMYTLAGTPKALGDDLFLLEFLALLRQKQSAPASVDTMRLLAMLSGVPEGFLNIILSHIRRFTDFTECIDKSWLVVRYERMIAGDLGDLSAALGVTVSGQVEVDPHYARVARTRGAGDWRHWFTARDIVRLRPVFTPLLGRLGYDDDWELSPEPQIMPEHSWGFLLRLIDERRGHYGMHPFRISTKMPAGPAPEECDICGGTTFGPGPGGRMSDNGQMPACSGAVLWSGSASSGRSCGRCLWAICQRAAHSHSARCPICNPPGSAPGQKMPTLRDLSKAALTSSCSITSWNISKTTAPPSILLFARCRHRGSC